MQWLTDEWQTLLSASIIFSGAAVMLPSILKTKELFKATPFVGKRSKAFIIRLLKIKMFLMIFFLVGYLVVALAFLMGQAIIGKFFVSLVFFLGAVFVLLGTILHARMLAEIQSTIQGLVPICFNCKKIRQDGADPYDQKSWTEIESYISSRTEAKFSHGLCPECLNKIRRKEKLAP